MVAGVGEGVTWMAVALGERQCFWQGCGEWDCIRPARAVAPGLKKLSPESFQPGAWHKCRLHCLKAGLRNEFTGNIRGMPGAVSQASRPSRPFSGHFSITLWFCPSLASLPFVRRR